MSRSGKSLTRVENEIEEVKGVMRDSMERIIDRDERLHLLEDRAVNLSTEARQFKKTATEVRRKMWWQNTKFKIILVIVILLILGGIGGVIYWKVK